MKVVSHDIYYSIIYTHKKEKPAVLYYDADCHLAVKIITSSYITKKITMLLTSYYIRFVVFIFWAKVIFNSFEPLF